MIYLGNSWFYLIVQHTQYIDEYPLYFLPSLLVVLSRPYSSWIPVNCTGCSGIDRLVVEHVTARPKRCRKKQRNWNVCSPPRFTLLHPPLLNSHQFIMITSILVRKRHLKLEHYLLTPVGATRAA